MNRAISVCDYPETEGSRETFYPTPPHMIDKLLAGIDWDRVGSALEPSAGKGDLALAVAKKVNARRDGYYRDTTKERDRRDVIERAGIDCIEIDPNLRHILTGEGFRVVHDDFLTFHTFKRYDLIVMNPPFDRGAEHLLKAISLIEANGGQIACLLNSETLRNPYSYARKQLQRALADREADIQHVDNAFARAERATDVAVTVVHLTVPAPEKKSGIMDAMRKDAERRKQDEPESEYKALIKGDYLEAIVDRYNYELSCGMRLIDEWIAMRPVLLEGIGKDEHYNYPILQLKIDGTTHRGGEDAGHDAYLKKVRVKYWSALFEQREFLSQLTSNLQEELRSMVQSLKDYDFSYYNIYTLIQQMLVRVNGGIEETILKLFDDWTIKYHWDENSQNRHYFDGWRTNDAFAVNKKVIIPFYGAFSSWSGKMDEYAVTSKITDIEKVFDYLDAGHTSGIDAITAIRFAAASETTRNIKCRHFSFTIYKKGTCHIVFDNLDVLHKFNLFAASKKNWLPPAYGKRRYKDMSQEERAVVDSFEGEKSYEDVMRRSEYFLQTAQTMPALLTGS